MRSYPLDPFDEEHQQGEDPEGQDDGDQIHALIVGPRSEGPIEKGDQFVQIL
jgi:hypothetical protein